MTITITASETRRAIVGAAESQLGEAETPRGSDQGVAVHAYLEAAGAHPRPDWSTGFVAWAWRQATGGAVPWGLDVGQAHEIVRWAKAHARWIRENDPRDTHLKREEPLPGDLLVTGDLTEPFLSRNEHYCHLSVVEEVGPATIVTIEGARHGLVTRARHSRAYDGLNRYIAGYIRIAPVDDTVEVPKAAEVSEVAHTLEDMAQHRLIVDLDHLTANHDLVRQVQTRLGQLGLMPPEEVDGVLGPHTYAALERFCHLAHLNSTGVRRFGPAFARKLIGLRAFPTMVRDIVPTSGGVIPLDFKKALAFTRAWEDPCVDHPGERGVVLSRGITQVEYDRHRMHFGDPTRPVQFMDEDEMTDIHHYLHWEPVAAGHPLPLAAVLFDTAVSMGVGSVPLFLQESMGLVVTGHLDAHTHEALQHIAAHELALRVIDARGSYRYKRLETEPGQHVFMHAWLARDSALREFLG